MIRLHINILLNLPVLQVLNYYQLNVYKFIQDFFNNLNLLTLRTGAGVEML